MASAVPDPEELDMLRESALQFCAREAPVDQLRRLRDTRDERGFVPEVWRKMVEQGWPGVALATGLGGAGMGQAGLGIIMESLGATLAASPMEASIMLGAGWLSSSTLSASQAAVLQSTLAGDTLLALAVQEGGHYRTDAMQTRVDRAGGALRLNGRKTNVWDICVADLLIVIADSDTGPTALLLDPTTPGVTLRRLHGLDNRQVGEVTFTDVAVAREAVIGGVGDAPATLERLERSVAAQTAAQLLGISQRVFDLTCEYLESREQFGAKIGSFQALQHRAASLFVELETSRALVGAALDALDAGAPDAALLAHAAKARMCRVSRTACAEAIQMHGGIGVTDELDIGLYLKRAAVLQQFLGDKHYHQDCFARLKGY